MRIDSMKNENWFCFILLYYGSIIPRNMYIKHLLQNNVVSLNVFLLYMFPVLFLLDEACFKIHNVFKTYLKDHMFSSIHVYKNSVAGI